LFRWFWYTLAALLQNRRTIPIEIDINWSKGIEKKIEKIKRVNSPDKIRNKDFLTLSEQ
jgi:hypothetical protein